MEDFQKFYKEEIKGKKSEDFKTDDWDDWEFNENEFGLRIKPDYRASEDPNTDENNYIIPQNKFAELISVGWSYDGDDANEFKYGFFSNVISEDSFGEYYLMFKHYKTIEEKDIVIYDMQGDDELFLIKKGNKLCVVNCYQCSGLEVIKNEINFFGWDDEYRIDMDTLECNTIAIR